ncbi:amino acid adenylation domain-containing protein [Streptomyces sp. NPDC050504]|uniref:amino acid adenylation domain-containing protein n=1 Tax=Streptomyces sp. NPDC050504 TaxID=3365618 RepID=UPI0037B8B36C
MPAEPPPPHPTIPDRFADRARRTPEAVAVVSDTHRLSYAQLDARAEDLAQRLRAAGATTGTRVAVLQERSAGLVVSLLAIAKSGACYVPLHTGYPADRMAWVMADTAAAVLLTDEASASFRFRHDARVLRVRPDGTTEGPAPEPSPAPGIHPLSLAYVMHTSGSTGRPKGVAVTHRAVADLAADPCWGDAARAVLLHAPYAFDISTYELWVPLLNGGRVVVAPPGTLDAEGLRRLTAEHALTAVHLTAGLFGAFAEESPEVFAPLREVLTGGDVVPPRAVRRVLEHAPGVRVRHLYGPTEITLFATHRALTALPVPEPLPLGDARAAARVRVLDDALRPVAAGDQGELYVAGSGVARGYLDRPAASAARFVPDPYGPPGERMFRTGDLVRLSPGSELEFIGRRDGQVKISGYRVELGEVEGALTAQPEVHQAVVLAVPDAFGDRRLVAYTTPHLAEGTLTEIRERLARALPAYMLPDAHLSLEALPLTPNGKIDREALPAPDRPRDNRPAQRPLEQALCEVYATLLKRTAPVGPEDDFFELGGHSLLAVRLLSRLRSLLGAELTVQDVFQTPTPRGLAARIAADGEEEENLTAPLLTLRGAGTQRPLFCVHPVLGLAWSYAALLPHLGPDLPVHGLQATGAPLGDTTLMETAAHYADRLREVQPHGPYRIAGWSLGGLLAHAVATTLQERGEEVSTLALIDSYPPRTGDGTDYGARESAVLRALLASIDPTAPASPDTPADRDSVVAALRAATGLADAEQLVDAALHHDRAAGSFTPRTFDGDLLFFSARVDRPEGLSADLWRSAVTGRVSDHPVAASHYEVLRAPAAGEIGRALAARLQEEPEPVRTPAAVVS